MIYDCLSLFVAYTPMLCNRIPKERILIVLNTLYKTSKIDYLLFFNRRNNLHLKDN